MAAKYMIDPTETSWRMQEHHLVAVEVFRK
jgi:hypothetical protein